jgi:galactoside O-acetyltransferase
MNKRLFSQENEYYDSSHLQKGLFASVGDNVRIARNCTIVGEENISIGDNVRIDGYCTIIATGNVRLGSYIHIGSYCHFSAGEGIVLEDFCNLSQGVQIYTRSDDYSGVHMTNPMVPSRYTSVLKGEVVLKRHVIIGAKSVVLPQVTIGEGSAVGALSLVRSSLDGWGIYGGCPVRRLKDRSMHLLELEKQLKSQ